MLCSMAGANFVFLQQFVIGLGDLLARVLLYPRYPSLAEVWAGFLGRHFGSARSVFGSVAKSSLQARFFRSLDWRAQSF